MQDAAPITTVTVSNTGMTGMAFVGPTGKTVAYTADGYNAQNPTDSFTCTVTDSNNRSLTGTIDLTITPSASLATQLGTSNADTLTASSANQRLIGGGGDDTLNVNAAKTLAFGG